MSPSVATDATLRPLTADTIPVVAELGREIWLAHYVEITGLAQVEYMTRERFSDAYLSAYLESRNRWLDLLWLGDQAVGYCSYALSENPAEMKLEQLYLRHDHHGRGLGRLMMAHVETQARAHGRHTVVLCVNKYNRSSINVYHRSGFTIREEAVTDIGNGFVMDDYIMEKQLA